MIDPGRLRHRIRILRHVPENSNGLDAGTDKEVCVVWAQVEDLSGREYFARNEIAADISTRIVLRWRDDIVPEMRAEGVDDSIAPPGQNVVAAVRSWDIQSVIDPDGKRAVLHLMCVQRLSS